MIGRRFARIQAERGADPALAAVTTAQARRFVVALPLPSARPEGWAAVGRGRADGIWSIGAPASREMGSWSSTDPVTRTNPHRRRPGLGWGGERVPLVAFGAGSSAEGGAMSRVAEPRRVTL